MRVPHRWSCAATLVLISSLLSAAEKKPWKDLNLEIGDIKMHYIEAGAGDRALVFIPGLSMPAEVWREQMPYFAARGYRVIAIDPRSHGLTTKTDVGNTYRQHAADLYAFLTTLKLGRAALVGWSEAVPTLLEFIASPEVTPPDKLVLVDGFPTGYKDGDYPAGMTPQQARSLALSFQEDRAKATDKFVRGMFKSKQYEIVYKDMISASLKMPTGTLISLFFDLYTGDRRPYLRRISAPTLVIVPAESRLLGEYLQTNIEKSKLEVIPDAGHAVFLDRPQAFNQVLETFLEAP